MEKGMARLRCLALCGRLAPNDKASRVPAGGLGAGKSSVLCEKGMATPFPALPFNSNTFIK
jgi:hypothetical protein